MATLAANSPDIEWRGAPDSNDQHSVKAGEVDILFRHQLSAFKGDGEGITVEIASGDDFAGIILADSLGTVAIGDRILVRTKGRFKVSNLANAIANAEDAQGSLFAIDVSVAGGDNVNQLRAANDATYTAAAGDINIARCVEWIDSTTVVLELLDNPTVV